MVLGSQRGAVRRALRYQRLGTQSAVLPWLFRYRSGRRRTRDKVFSQPCGGTPLYLAIGHLSPCPPAIAPLPPGPNSTRLETGASSTRTVNPVYACRPVRVTRKRVAASFVGNLSVLE